MTLTLDRVTELWSDWMSAMAWQAALLIGVAFLLDRLIRGWAWPQLRHALWIVVGLKLVLPPTLSSPVSVVPTLAPEMARTATTVEGSSASGAPWLFAVWAAGALVAAALLLAGRYARRRALGRSSTTSSKRVEALVRKTAEQLGLRRAPGVWIHDHVGPAVFGLLRPTVVLPADVATGRASQLRHVLLHELAHIKRRDLWSQAAFAFLSVVYWFHPLVHLARRRATAMRELCCDATVAAHLRGDTRSYRATLLRSAARALLEPPRHLGAAGFFFGRSTILMRLAALERPHWKHPLRRAAVTALVVATLLLTVVPMTAAAVDLLPGPSLEARLERARATVARMAEDPERFGCLEYRYQVMYVQALEDELAARVRNE